MDVKYRLSLLFLLLFSLFQGLFAQENQKYVLDKLLDFHSIQKEVAYLHLNKSLLLKGEQLGFSAYVINPNGFKPSTKTTNLYVQIKNAGNEVVKEKMLLIENGTGASTFDIDSTFTAGNYSIIAFTNWMRNFEQQYYFQEEIEILSSYQESSSTAQKIKKIDAQFLPESGHLIKNRYNNLGVVIKDNQGYGLSKATVRLITSNNKLAGITRLDKFGIGTISFIPDDSESYKALIDHNGKTFTEKISFNIHDQGIIISTKFDEKNVEVSLITNLETMETLGETPFVFSIQSSYGATTYDVNFQGVQDIVIPLALEDLKPGVNIFSLFDKNNKPIAERLFFNYKKLSVLELGTSTRKNSNDSIQITLPTNKFADSTFLSVSVLPKRTVANRRNHNIASYLFLQPFVKGNIEGGDWYFNNIDADKKIALDNLLLTQGWSSYDWKKIFNRTDELLYSFEKYVDIKAQINNRKEKDEQFLMHASSTNSPIFIDIPEEKDSFIFEGLIPIDGENLFISRIKKNGTLLPAGLSVQFFPHHIKPYKPKTKPLPYKSPSSKIEPDNYFFDFNNFGEEFEQLSEVLLEVKVDKKTIRERELNNHAWGRVDVLEESEKLMFNTLANYLTAQGFSVNESPTQFLAYTQTATGRMTSTPNSGSDQTFSGGMGSDKTGVGGGVAIFIDDMPIYDTARLYQYSLANVDYIEINKNGMGSGFLGSNGSVKIYTDYTRPDKNLNYRTRVQKFNFPISYAANKQFYVPKYSNTTDDFFQQYGVIDWKSNLFSSGQKNISFEISKPQVDFLLIIEGFTSNGELIYKVENISAQ